MTLSFVVGEKESLVFPDGPAQGGAELVLAELIETRCRQGAGSVQHVVAKILVDGAVQTVGAALGDDVNDAAYRPPELRAVAAVDDPEFFHRILRGRRFLNAGGSGHVVRAVDRHKVVVNVLSRERELGHGLDNHIGTAGRGVADGHAGRQQGEVNELPTVHREAFDFLLIDNGANHDPCGFRQFAHILYSYFLSHLPYGQVEVQVGAGSYIKMDLFCLLLESSLFGGHRIVTNRQERNLVIACCTRGRETRKTGGCVDRRNRGLRDRSPRGVINPTLNRDRDHLRVQGQNQTCENGQSQSVGPRRQSAPWTSVCKIGIHTLLLEAV